VMGDALVSEFLIALFALIVAVLSFRRNTPRSVELLAWGGLIWVCVMGVTATREAHARALTAAAIWGSGQMVGTLIWLGLQSVLDWIAQRRFIIADWVVLLFGVDLLVLVLLSSRRQGARWQPRVRLRDWMELPTPSRPQPRRVAEYGPDAINRRFNVWAPAALTWITLLLIWTGDVVMPSAARRLRRAAASAEDARRRVGRVAMEPRVIDMDVLGRGASALTEHARHALNEVGSAPQIDWLGGITMMPNTDGGIDEDGNERDRRHRLAS
jgi:hypothetical protein